MYVFRRSSFRKRNCGTKDLNRTSDQSCLYCPSLDPLFIARRNNISMNPTKLKELWSGGSIWGEEVVLLIRPRPHLHSTSGDMNPLCRLYQMTQTTRVPLLYSTWRHFFWTLEVMSTGTGQGHEVGKGAALWGAKRILRDPELTGQDSRET